jgi:adenosylmethionine-8-amino-7-oxononanoate aminotransferase
MAVSRDPVFFGRFEPLLCEADILPIDATRLDEHLTTYRGQVAAVVIEPLVQGAGGMRMHAPEALRAIAEVTQRHDVLFIADEVMTGGGRTGTLWAHQAAGITPDLVCAAKTLAGGILPLAATIVGRRVVASFETADRTRTFFHGHSFTAHPLACAVAFGNAMLLDRKETLEKPRSIETHWRQAIEPLRHVLGVKDVRIRGSIAAVELNVDGGYLADAGRKMRLKAHEMDVLLRPLGSVLYAMPPFCTSPSSLERIAEAMHAAVKAVTS